MTKHLFPGIADIDIWFQTNIGLMCGNGLSENAIEWLINNEPGFKERIYEVVEKVNKERLTRVRSRLDVSVPVKPRPGYIYILRATDTNLYKVGLTTSKKPESRLSNIQVSSPIDIHKVIIFKVDDTVAEEAKIHDRLKRYRQRGEWFEIAKIAIINNAIKEYGVSI